MKPFFSLRMSKHCCHKHHSRFSFVLTSIPFSFIYLYFFLLTDCRSHRQSFAFSCYFFLLAAFRSSGWYSAIQLISSPIVPPHIPLTLTFLFTYREGTLYIPPYRFEDEARASTYIHLFDIPPSVGWACKLEK